MPKKEELCCPGSVPAKLWEKRWFSVTKTVVTASKPNPVLTSDICTDVD